MDHKIVDCALKRLASLPSGRHYGASADSECWVMIGRNLIDVTDWSIVPPASSLTFAWGEGGCFVEFSGGSLQMRPGDWMWIDAGFVHRGQNLPNSDFLTVFVPKQYVDAAALDITPIGAAAQRAPQDLVNMLIVLAALLLEGTPTQSVESPFLNPILHWVRTTFEPQKPLVEHTHPVSRAAAMLREHQGNEMPIVDVAIAVGLSVFQLSRQFKDCYRVTPQVYRKQVRLSLATHALLREGSVLAAAHDAGFSDSAHFSRTFREQYGISPSRWLRRVTGGATIDNLARESLPP